MLKLMIAEDEALERKALKFLFDKFYKDSIEVVCDASNGQDAVDNAIKYKPDIILMDINMPIIDGLEAGKIIKEKCPNTEFIILTAFNYFDYAKKAISIGASDYLLKPVSNEDFCNSIDKLSDKIKSKKLEEVRRHELSENYKKAMPFVQREMITNIVYGGTLSSAEFNEYRKMLDISSDEYCCIIFNCNNNNLLNEQIIKKIQIKLKFVFSEVIGAICLNDIVIFAFDDETEQKQLSNKSKKVISDIQENMKSEKGIDLYVGIGSANQKSAELYTSYRQARLSLHEKKESVKDGKNENYTNVLSNADLNDKVTIIVGKIINENVEDALNETDNLLDYLVDNVGSNEKSNIPAIAKVFSETFAKIIEGVTDFMGAGSSEIDKDNIIEELRNLKQIVELNHYGHMTIKRLIKDVSKFKKSKNVDIVEKVKRYMEQNFPNDITLDELSQQVYMSSFYLSRVFSKIEGMSIRDYLIKIRMEKAKKMLRQEGRSIKQVGIEVGYQDQNYFSRAFKKYTHLSPKEYSNL